MTRQLRIDHPSAVHAAVHATRNLARDAGLPEGLVDRAAVITAELAGNLDKHAKGGVVYLQQALTGTGIEILAADDGPGMADLDHWRTDGHTTTGTLGTGLGAVSRMATDFRIESIPGVGTLAAARVLSVAGGAMHFCLPREGEDHCGDAVAVAASAGGWTAVVADGLGHGPAAAEASEAALRVFRADPARPLPEHLKAMHQALRRTRGAAVALARATPGRVEFCGVGNVAGTTFDGGRPRLLLSVPGVVGFTLPPAPVRVLTTESALVVLHTDGVDPAWSAHAPTFPHPALLAATLVHRHRIPRDDAAMLALRQDRPA